MNLVKYRPFQNILSLEKNLNRLFDFDNESFFGQSNWLPEVDVYETDNEFIMEAECPGINSEDIKLTLENNVLTLTGEKKNSTEEKKGNYHRIERSYGSFSRSFTLPSTVDTNSINAEYEDGIIKIRAAKTEKSTIKQIEVKSNKEAKVISTGAG